MTEPLLIYDGECPFCSRYARLVRLRETVGKLRLLNARDGGPEVDAVRQAGLSLDDGMVLHLDGNLYHGDDALRRIALLSSPSTIFNRVNFWIFRSRIACQLLYPLLRWGRSIALFLLGRRKIDQ